MNLQYSILLAYAKYLEPCGTYRYIHVYIYIYIYIYIFFKCTIRCSHLQYLIQKVFSVFYLQLNVWIAYYSKRGNRSKTFSAGSTVHPCALWNMKLCVCPGESGLFICFLFIHACMAGVIPPNDLNTCHKMLMKDWKYFRAACWAAPSCTVNQPCSKPAIFSTDCGLSNNMLVWCLSSKKNLL